MDRNRRLAGALVLALAAGAAGADRFADYLPPRSYQGARLPEVRREAAAPFGKTNFQAIGALGYQKSKVLLNVQAAATRELEVAVYRGRFPTAAEIRKTLARGNSLSLPTETHGEALFSRTTRARKEVLQAWKTRLAAVEKDPDSLLPQWVRRNQHPVNRDKRGRYTGGFDAGPLNVPGKAFSQVNHGVQVGYLQSHHYLQGHALDPKGYGSDQDGYRREPWVAFRAAYTMRYQTEVELPEPGVYVVVAKGEHGENRSAFLHSDLELVARRDHGDLYLQTVSRRDGEPRGGVEIEAFGTTHVGNNNYRVAEARGETSGAGSLDLAPPSAQQSLWLVLRDGKHRFFVQGPGQVHQSPGAATFHLTSDRPVYKPGETIQFRGIVRRVGDQLDVGVAEGEVQVGLGWDDRTSTKVKLGDLGTFHGSLEIPRDQRTGTLMLRAQLMGGSLHGQGTHNVEVLAYRKPEHEVLAEPAKPWTLQGETARVRLHGRFTVGGNVQGAKVRWRTRPLDAGASPHGATVARRGEGGGWTWRERQGAAGPHGQGEDVLDDQGRFEVPIELTAADRDYSLGVDVDMISPDGRTVNTSTTFFAPRAELALGLKSTQGVVDEGDPWVVLGRTLDLEGADVGAQVRLELRRRRWEKRKDGSWHEVLDPIRKWTETVGPGGKAQWEIPIPLAGNIELVARAKDAAGRETSTMVTTYRYGKDAPVWRWDRLELSADKDQYQPGQTARVLLRCPLESGSAWWSLEGASLRLRGRAEVRGYNARIEVPLAAADMPEAKLHVEILREGQRLTRDLNLEVPASARRAEVELATDARVYQPGDEVAVAITARDEDGKGLAGELCLAVVDEALDQVAADRTRDLYETFYGTRPNRVQGIFDYRMQMFGAREGMMLGGMAKGMAMRSAPAPSMAPGAPLAEMAMADSLDSEPGSSGGGGGGIKIRSEFRDVAYWVGAVRTDMEGRGTLAFKLPDDLARWRLVAYWVDRDTRVARSSHRVIARKDLMVRLGLPRFLTVGDHVLVKSSVQNMSQEDRRGELSFETLGAAPVPLGTKDLEALGVREDPASGWLVSAEGPVKKAPDRYDLTVPAEGHDAVDFPIFVHRYPAGGRMHFRSVFDSRGDGDGLLKEIPVVPFARRSTEVTLHEVKDARTRIEVEQREGTVKDATAVSLDLMLNLEQATETALVDDLNRLIEYRYGCTEQTLSRFVPLASAYAALGGDWLAKAGVARAGELEKILDKGIERLKQLRSGNGWGWGPGDQPSPSTTAYLIGRVYRMPDPYRSRLVKELDLGRAVRWLRQLYDRGAEAAIDREEQDDRVWALLQVYQAYEALALAGQSVTPPRIAKLQGLTGNPRLWACFGAGALAQGRADLARQARERLAELSEGGSGYRLWRHTGRRWSWYADDTETTALILEFLRAVGGADRALTEGLRWATLGPGATGYRSTKARAAAVGVAAGFLSKAPPRANRSAARVEVVADRTQVREVSPDPRARRKAVVIEAPELVRAGGTIELRKAGGPELLARMDTTRYVKGPFRPRDEGFSVRSRLELGGSPHPSHRDMVRVIDFEVREEQRYALLEVPLISGAEVPTKDERRPKLRRRNERDDWYDTWQEVDVLDDRVVFYFRWISPGRYQARVTMNPELAGYHNMLPARMFLMYFPEVEGTSESHRVRIGRE
jgi:uncharacterized protein YfaS (alpha-2-macroglobulin family)